MCVFENIFPTRKKILKYFLCNFQLKDVPTETGITSTLDLVIHEQYVNWFNARDGCVSAGKNLLVIDSLEEQNEVVTFVTNNHNG